MIKITQEDYTGLHKIDKDNLYWFYEDGEIVIASFLEWNIQQRVDSGISISIIFSNIKEPNNTKYDFTRHVAEGFVEELFLYETEYELAEAVMSKMPGYVSPIDMTNLYMQEKIIKPWLERWPSLAL